MDNESNMNMNKNMKNNRDGVSPIIATILMVLITLVLLAVLYAGHGPTYWNYHGAACTLEYDMPFNATEMEAFFENNSFMEGYYGSKSVSGGYNRTAGGLVSCNIRENGTGNLTITIEGYFNESGRCSFTSESRMDREVAEHYEADNQTFAIEVEYFIQIFEQHFGKTPNGSNYYPNIDHSCFQSYD